MHRLLLWGANAFKYTCSSENHPGPILEPKTHLTTEWCDGRAASEAYVSVLCCLYGTK